METLPHILDAPAVFFYPLNKVESIILSKLLACLQPVWAQRRERMVLKEYSKCIFNPRANNYLAATEAEREMGGLCKDMLDFFDSLKFSSVQSNSAGFISMTSGMRSRSNDPPEKNKEKKEEKK